MSDTNPSIDPAEWQMPEPTFRSTEGRTVRNNAAEIDIPTESKFGLPFESASQSVRQAPIVKKRGCASTMLVVLAIVVVAILAVIAALVYFLFFYSPADTTF